MINSAQPAGGSPYQNGIPNATQTREQLRQFIEASAGNALSFAIYRNPTIVYQYIQQNYEKQFPTMLPGAETTMPQMESMYKFLERKYNDLRPGQRRHFLATILHSLPRQAQLQNWTTPIN